MRSTSIAPTDGKVGLGEEVWDDIGQAHCGYVIFSQPMGQYDQRAFGFGNEKIIYWITLWAH